MNFDLCPAGFYPLGDTCVKDNVFIDSELQPVIFDTAACHPPIRQGGDDPQDGDTGACTATEPVDRCRSIKNTPYWNPLTCMCEATPP